MKQHPSQQTELKRKGKETKRGPQNWTNHQIPNHLMKIFN